MPSNANLVLYEHRNKKLPLAILIHHNFFLSLIYAVVAGLTTFQKRDDSSDSLNSSLLLPAYWTWIVVEASRLITGQRGVLVDSSPALSAFLLLSFFPQMFVVLYMGCLQETILPLDRWSNAVMLALIFAEMISALKLLHSMATGEKAATQQSEANK